MMMIVIVIVHPRTVKLKWYFYAGSILESHKKDFFEADSYDDDDNDF